METKKSIHCGGTPPYVSYPNLAGSFIYCYIYGKIHFHEKIFYEIHEK